jgi:glutamate---cysteine ligase / carboxylate-amine ligase
MDELAFSPSAALTLGVELELQLARPHDLDLSRDAAELLGRLAKRKLPGAVKPEITESMIELNSSVHSAAPALLEELETVRKVVVQDAGVLNVRIAGGGSHPFHDWADRRIYPNERFLHVVERYGYLAKQFTVFGQHIHIGCASGDDAIFLTHILTRYVPHFIALSAASPFYQGEDTSFQSSRLTAVSAFPLAGHIPFVRDWSEFVEYFMRMKSFGIVSSMKDFYWDIRPKPEYGTVEIRVCDTPLTVRRAALLAAYAQALAAWHLEARPLEPSRTTYTVNSYNRFEACRYGLRGAMVDPYVSRKAAIGTDILEAVQAIAPHAARLGSGALLEELAAGVRRGESDAEWLRRCHAARGSLADVVRDACARWESGA